jgi:hypothetical protein
MTNYLVIAAFVLIGSMAVYGVSVAGWRSLLTDTIILSIPRTMHAAAGGGELGY